MCLLQAEQTGFRIQVAELPSVRGGGGGGGACRSRALTVNVVEAELGRRVGWSMRLPTCLSTPLGYNSPNLSRVLWGHFKRFSVSPLAAILESKGQVESS